MIIEDIETKAEKVLKDAGIHDVPVAVEEIAALQQIRISRAPNDSFSGLLLRKDGKALIGVNSAETKTRQRFTIAHELGHFFLHRNKDAFVDFRDNVQGVIRTPREREANMFAAALLMPRKKVLADVRALAKQGVGEDEVTILAKRYAVSEDAMRFRLINLRIFDE